MKILPKKGERASSPDLTDCHEQASGCESQTGVKIQTEVHIVSGECS